MMPNVMEKSETQLMRVFPNSHNFWHRGGQTRNEEQKQVSP